MRYRHHSETMRSLRILLARRRIGPDRPLSFIDSSPVRSDQSAVVSSVGVYGLLPAVSMPTLAPSFLHRKVVTTLCPSGSDRMEYLCKLIANSNIDLSPLFTHRMKLDDMPKAYDLFRSKAEGVLKIAITP